MGPHNRHFIGYFEEDVQNLSKPWKVDFSANIVQMQNFAIICEYYCDNMQINGHACATANVITAIENKKYLLNENKNDSN